MSKPWTVKNGIYKLKIDNKENRESLVEALTAKIRKDGNKNSVKGILIGDQKKPYRISTNSMKDLFDEKSDLLKIKPSGSGGNRTIKEVRPGANVRANTPVAQQTKELTNQFIERVSGIEGSTPEKIQRYFEENNKALRKLYVKVGTENQKLLKAGIDKNQRISRGHFARLSRSIDSPRNLFVELLTENIAKGDKYSPNPAAMTAIGNPVKEGLDPLENWARDYTTWLDKPENGGSGILPQRGDYSDLLEQKYNQITGEQWNKLDPVQKKAAIDTIDDLTRNTEKLNQFLPSEGAARRKWGLLLPDQAAQASELVTDGIQKTPNITSTGRPVGGISDQLKVKTKRPNILNKVKIGAGLLGASNFLPTKAGAEQIHQEVSQGKLGDATKTYGKDLLVGQAASRSMGSALKIAQSRLAKTLGPQLARQALKIAGRQVLKKGAALATGPAAPAVMAGLLIKDAYDVANVISGGKLTIKKNKDMNQDERKKAVDSLKFIK